MAFYPGCTLESTEELSQAIHIQTPFPEALILLVFGGAWVSGFL